MFTKNTVFVLGAGASWHYGYPTGERLVLDVLANARRYLSYCENRIDGGLNIGDMPHFMFEGLNNPSSDVVIDRWRTQVGLARELISTLEDIEPLVIDYFLGWNSRLHDIGRLMIAAALLERETGERGLNYNRTHAYGAPLQSGKDNWLRFIVHQLLIGCKSSDELLNNRVKFITFNYDRSLERTLQQSLAAVGMLNGIHIDAFLRNDRIIHLYGELASHVAVRSAGYQALEGTFKSAGAIQRISDANALIDIWHAASSNIRVIDPHTKTKAEELEPAQSAIVQADAIYFLGFGFDELNLQRLGFPLKREKSRAISYTNYNDAMTVNKRAAKAFELPALTQQSISSRGNMTVERSVRNVYDAIELDFGTLSE